MAKIKKVVATVWYDKQNMHDLRQVFPDAQFVYVDFFDKKRLAQEVKDADVAILMGDVDPCLLGENTLQWIHCDHAGLNGSARPEVFDRGIPVTGAAGRSAPVLAEHCVYFMLQGCYHTRELLDAQAKGQWGVPGMKDWRGLYGRTAGIVGMGNNGRMLAQRLHAFGMRLIAYDKRPIQGFDYLEQKLCADEGDSLQPLLEASDFVVLTLALTDETFHMIKRETLAQMKPGAFLVNMARGGIVCTEDLVEALRSGHLSGAGLDVFETQPLPADHPLWTMPNVYITPHDTPQVPNRAGRSIEIIRENARRFEAGEPLLNLMKPTDAMDNAKAEGGWARLMSADLSPDKVDIAKLEKHLGKRDWSDPKEWL